MALWRTGPAAALLLIGGCTVGPDYHAPAVAVPAAYGASRTAESSSADLGTWWTLFGDPALNALIERARSGNLDVRQAAARVEEARAQQRVTQARGGPSLNASGQAGYTRLSKNSLPSSLAQLGGGGNGQSGGGTAIGLPGEDFATFQAGFDASWEIDLFGGQRRANEAAAARTDAAIWSQRDAEVTLAAEVGRIYEQFRALQRRLALADATLAAKREALSFTRVRTAHGLVNTVDERRQEQDIQQVAAQREDLLAQADADIHALGTLLGLAPTSLGVELSGAATAPPLIEVPAGLPAELLRRRPDIRAAERRLAAATADIGAATADLYPKLSLTGALQLVSRSLATLLESESLFTNGAGRLSLPLIGGGKRETVALRRTQANEALIAYEAAIIGALRDVEDALTRLQADRRKVADLQGSVAAAQDAADTAGVRQRNGLVPMTEVLQARQTWLSGRDALAQAEAAAVQDQVALYKALGGGWDERRASEEEPDSGRRS